MFAESWQVQVRCRKAGSIGLFDISFVRVVQGATRDEVVAAALATCREEGYEPHNVEGFWPWPPGMNAAGEP